MALISQHQEMKKVKVPSTVPTGRACSYEFYEKECRFEVAHHQRRFLDSFLC
jgi:hypothetical protein